MEGEAVDDLLEVLHVADVRREDEAVLARDAMAFDDLGGALGEPGDLRQLPRRGADADDRGQGVAERAGIDRRAVARDHPRVLETADEVTHRRRGEPDAA